MTTRPDLDVQVPVLVLKLCRNVIQHGTLAVIRSLGSLGVPVYARVEDRFAPAALSRYLSDAFLWEKNDAGAESLIGHLSDMAERIERKAILLPTDDLASVFIAEHAQTLEKWFLFPRLPRELPRRLANKKELYFLCRSIGVPCPEAAFPTSLDEVHRFIANATFPVVVKAAESQRLSKGGRSVSIAQTPQELVALYRQAEANYSSLILQEYIPEFCAEDWVFSGYCNRQTSCLLSFTGRKLRSHPPFAGFTTLGVSARNDAVRIQTEKFLRAVGYAGIMDIDYRLDKRDGTYKLLDFNPRVGANFRMFENSDGVDVVRALHLDMTGRQVRALPTINDRKFVVEPYDLAASLGYLRHGGLTFRKWHQSLNGQMEAAWFQWDDPVPPITMCARLMSRVVKRTIRQIWSRFQKNWPKPQGPAATRILSKALTPVRAPAPGQPAQEPVLTERK